MADHPTFAAKSSSAWSKADRSKVDHECHPLLVQDWLPAAVPSERISKLVYGVWSVSKVEAGWNMVKDPRRSSRDGAQSCWEEANNY
jgi:hypothetical protein